VKERLGERHHGMLGHVVRAGAGRRDEAGDRSGVDDVALVLRDQPRREGAHAVDHAPEIDAEDPLPVADAVFPYRAEGRDARVVADQERLVDASGEFLNVLLFGDVHAHRNDRRAGKKRSRFPQSPFIDIGER
jgi:hypothetical protein